MFRNQRESIEELKHKQCIAQLTTGCERSTCDNVYCAKCPKFITSLRDDLEKSADELVWKNIF